MLQRAGEAGEPLQPLRQVRRDEEAQGGDRQQRNIPVIFVDFGFFETYGIDVVAGRAFSAAFGRDRLVLDAATGGATQGNFVLNERAARELGWTAEEAVGKRLEVPRIPGLRGEVVGVVADVLESVRTPPGSTVYLVPSAARGPFGPLLTQASLPRSTQSVKGRMAKPRMPQSGPQEFWMMKPSRV